ncbi:hypothetical protein QJS04_geneDACA022168 [Acorus gramineus]|uniref:Sm domain-containing protein n=1 Tax=Acorus gramineus TaxID=55184 RepID=A0AAV9BM88_ACOGR|nr:hypothetical protein QJS04_geneDACA022168 [Acorus gramineus]
MGDPLQDAISTVQDVNWTPETNESPNVHQLRKLLYRRMMVGVNDGRFFAGSFNCIDKQGNIILQDALEYRPVRCSSPSPYEQRCLGLILIPASCRTSCHVEASLEEQLSGLSIAPQESTQFEEDGNNI